MVLKEKQNWRVGLLLFFINLVFSIIPQLIINAHIHNTYDLRI